MSIRSILTEISGGPILIPDAVIESKPLMGRIGKFDFEITSLTVNRRRENIDVTTFGSSQRQYMRGFALDSCDIEFLCADSSRLQNAAMDSGRYPLQIDHRVGDFHFSGAFTVTSCEIYYDAVGRITKGRMTGTPVGKWDITNPAKEAAAMVAPSGLRSIDLS